jgi:hypothetical protein
MHLTSTSSEAMSRNDPALRCGRKLLMKFEFVANKGARANLDYMLGSLIGSCFAEGENYDEIIKIARNVNRSNKHLFTYSFDFSYTLNLLAKANPIAFLDVFLGEIDETRSRRRYVSLDNDRSERNPLSRVPDEIIISWCEQDADIRFRTVLSHAPMFDVEEKTRASSWKPLVLMIINRAPDLEQVLEEISQALRPSSWSGSLTDLLYNNLLLLQQLFRHENDRVVRWAKAECAKLQDELEEARRTEEQWRRERDQSFE